jgi:hypothetical protein
MTIISKENLEWSAHRLSKEISQQFNKDNTLVINTTWLSKDDIASEVESWVQQNNRNKVVVLNLFDPPNFSFGEYTDQIIDVNCKDFCFWLLAVDRFFLPYTIEDVTPGLFEHKFLCYQRKPTSKRNYIFNQLKDKDGIITIGSQDFSDINSSIPSHAGLAETGNNTLKVGNDIWSLGDLGIWNSCFLNIVSETDNPMYSGLFVSEKIFKPMVGLRPFICFGNHEVTQYLKSLGFETFDEEFGYRPTADWKNNVEQIANLVDHLDASIYNSLMPKLLHNKNWLKTAANAEWQKVKKLAEEV